MTTHRLLFFVLIWGVSGIAAPAQTGGPQATPSTPASASDIGLPATGEAVLADRILAWVDDEGALQIRSDIYRYDERMKKAFGLS